MGVRGVTNEITLHAVANTEDLKARIQEALKWTAISEGKNIHARVKGSHVVLTGNVRSMSEIEDATNAVWNAPGMHSFENHLKIVM